MKLWIRMNSFSILVKKLLFKSLCAFLKLWMLLLILNGKKWVIFLSAKLFSCECFICRWHFTNFKFILWYNASSGTSLKGFFPSNFVNFWRDFLSSKKFILDNSFKIFFLLYIFSLSSSFFLSVFRIMYKKKLLLRISWRNHLWTMNLSFSLCQV